MSRAVLRQHMSIGGLTRGSGVHPYESSIDGGGVFAGFPLHSVGLAAQAVRSFIKIDIVIRPVQRP